MMTIHYFIVTYHKQIISDSEIKQVARVPKLMHKIIFDRMVVKQLWVGFFVPHQHLQWLQQLTIIKGPELQTAWVQQNENQNRKGSEGGDQIFNNEHQATSFLIPLNKMNWFVGGTCFSLKQVISLSCECCGINLLTFKAYLNHI